MFHTAISASDELDPLEATDEVIRECRKQMAPVAPQVGIVVTSCMDADFERMLGKINRSFPDIKLIGCTTDGEICSDRGFTEDSVALLLFASDTVDFGTAVAEDISISSTQSFARAYEECCSQLSCKPSCGIVFPDGMTTVGIGLDSLIQQVCGDKVPIFGGAAGDHYQFEKTYQFYGTKVLSDSVPILLLGGPVQVEARALNGWTPIGRHFSVDSSENNRVYSIDGKSAKEFYRAHLGPQAQIISHIPLAVYRGESDNFFLREALDINNEDGSIEFIGSFPHDAKVRLTTVFREDVIFAADQVNSSVLSASGSNPDLIFIFSCATRRHILGSQTQNELRALREFSGLPYFGFYCYGEYGPITEGGLLQCQSDSYIAVALKVMEQ